MGFIENLLEQSKLEVTENSRALGIDLGTTNSTVAEVIFGPEKEAFCKTVEIEQLTREGVFTSPLIPSMVAVMPDKEIWVGEGPKRLRAISQEAMFMFEKNLFYDTKNEMGLRKTYYRAPKRFNHASKIAGHVLEFLKKGAENTTGNPYKHISVTVPASFQLNQRRDTLLACKYAGLDLKDYDLLDEPTAALIEYMQSSSHEKVMQLGEASVCMVFDFGGGTCDVSVVEILSDKKLKKISMSQLSVSRYHRLGGGDIDTSIVHEHLIPMLLKENNLSALDLTWSKKKKSLEPQLLGKAEALKIALCDEVTRLKKFGKYKGQDKSKIIVNQPRVRCKVGKDEFSLSKPSLSAEKFEELLKPFLDRDFLYAKETEYKLTQSIFAPLEDALQRAEKQAYEVDFCLMVGGSSLIPQVKDSVEEYFDKGVVGFFEDHLAMQVAVAKGAAWNAAVKSLTGRPLIEPVLHDGIALVTADGNLNPLIPTKVALPFPLDGSYAREKLFVPKGELKGNKIRFEVVGEEERQHIFNEVWTLPEGVEAGDEITMEYRITGGKQFECSAFLNKAPESTLKKTIENPLVNILNPNEIRVKIEEAEEVLRGKGGGSVEDRGIIVEIAEWYDELGQTEKALDYLRMALNKIQKPDPSIIFMQGNYFSKLKDYKRAEKAYRESDRIMQWEGALFNLALNFYKRGLLNQALETVEEAIEKGGRSGPNLSLKALCQKSAGNSGDAKKTLTEAMGSFKPVDSLNEWELGWYYDAAKRLGDEKYIRKSEEAWKKKRRKDIGISRSEIPRPSVKSDSWEKE